MKWIALLSSSCALGVVVSGCADSRTLDLSTINKEAQPTTTERSWRRELLRLNPEHPPVPTRLLAPLRARLDRAITAGGGDIVRLKVDWVDGPAPDLVIATNDPARYLKHGMPRITHVLRTVQTLYVAVVDSRGAPVLEWSHAGNSGTVFVKHGLERCSPVVAIGWPSNLPTCPSA
jgi:hypothetical protein